MEGLVSIVGHAREQALLRELRTHALLFVGQPGVGRRQVARWYAALQNCATPDAPCGRCESCRLFSQGLHPDYREVAPQATTASGRLSRRPEIRIAQLVPREGEAPDDALSRWLETPPRYRARVGVIDGAETLGASAANAFLKMLEEPPSHARIILIAPSPQAVLPTLASRCTVVRFGTVPLTESDHPAARLGRVGELKRAEAEPERFAELTRVVDGYVRALTQGLEQALEAADALEKHWLADAELGIAELLLARLSSWPSARYARASDALLRFQESVAAYAPVGLATQVLTLELRAILQDRPNRT